MILILLLSIPLTEGLVKIKFEKATNENGLMLHVRQDTYLNLKIFFNITET